MSDESRRRILARRSRFLAAALVTATSAAVPACKPKPCLEPLPLDAEMRASGADGGMVTSATDTRVDADADAETADPYAAIPPGACLQVPATPDARPSPMPCLTVGLPKPPGPPPMACLTPVVPTEGAANK